jgi:hypothetical protein
MKISRTGHSYDAIAKFKRVGTEVLADNSEADHLLTLNHLTTKRSAEVFEKTSEERFEIKKRKSYATIQ